MRCHYLSDLHLERQDFHWSLPQGEVLIIAGDLCHARCLAPEAKDKYNVDQRARVLRFIDQALAKFARVLLVPGNHEHYDGVFDATAGLLKTHLPGVVVLDDEHVVIGGVSFFGATLWTDFAQRSQACLDGVRRRCGEFFFVKKRRRDGAGAEVLSKFQPEDALVAFDASWQALQTHLASARGTPSVVISHHAPSRLGLNKAHAGNGLDGAFASDLDDRLAACPDITNWIHGHTHVRRTYRIGETTVRANCRGFEGTDISARTFAPNAYFDI
jgi:hypothetical protein